MTTSDEIRDFYVIQMELENTFGNEHRNLRNHFKFIKSKKGGNIGMGFDRFSVIRRNFVPNEAEIREIVDILSENSKSMIQRESVMIFLFLNHFYFYKFNQYCFN